MTAEAQGRLRDPKAEDGWGRGVENGTQRTSSGQTTQVSGHSQQLSRGAECPRPLRGQTARGEGKEVMWKEQLRANPWRPKGVN